MQNNPLTTAELADAVGVNDSRIRQLAPELEKDGLAFKVGRDWRFSPSAAEWIKNQPDGRGRPRTITRISSDTILSFLDMELGTVKETKVLDIIRQALIAAGCREKTY